MSTDMVFEHQLRELHGQEAGRPRPVKDLVYRAAEEGVSDQERDTVLAEHNVHRMDFAILSGRYRKRTEGERLVKSGERRIREGNRLIEAGNRETAEFHRQHPHDQAGPGTARNYVSEDSDRGHKLVITGLGQRMKGWRLLGRPDIPGADPESARPDLVENYLSALQTGGKAAERNEVLARYNRDIGGEIRKLDAEIETTEHLAERLADGDVLLKRDSPEWRASVQFWTDLEAKEKEGQQPDARPREAIYRELKAYLQDLRARQAKVVNDRGRVNALDAEIEGSRKQAQTYLDEILDAKRGMNWQTV